LRNYFWLSFLFFVNIFSAFNQKSKKRQYCTTINGKKSKQDMVASLVVKVRTLFHFQTTQTISRYMFCTFQATLIKLILFIIARYIKYK